MHVIPLVIATLVATTLGYPQRKGKYNEVLLILKSMLFSG
jgi:hypothetical protein